MKLTDIPIDRPIATLMLLISLVVLGAVAIARLPLDFMPMVEPPVVQVSVPFAGSHPLEALRDVAQPIEEEVATIADLRGVHASASSGEASVRAEFDWSANIDIKKMEVREAVERVRGQLPRGIGHIRIEGFQDGPAGGAILEGRISAQRNLSESWDLLDRRIRRPLERIKGVARIELGGVEPQQLRIEIDPVALKRHGIQAREVLEAIEGANLDMDLGAVRGDLLRYDVRSLGRFRTVEEIGELKIGRDGARLRDVARVELREPILEYGRHLDREFAISISAFKEPTANTVETVDRLLERIEEIKRDPELRGITLLVWENAGEEIRRSIAGLRNAGLQGGILAVVVLFLFLRRIRTTMVIAAAVPFSLIVACGAMYLMGSGLNVLTMLGLMLGVGMLVDNAVVVVENIHRLEGRGMPARDAARIGARQVALAVLAATATTVIVWSWLFTSERGPLTIYMGAVALTICLSVICSLIISLTFIPLAAAHFVPRRKVRPGFLLTKVVPAYRGVLAWTLRHRMVTLSGLLVLAGSAAVPITLIEKTGEPSFQEQHVSIFYRAHDPSDKDVMEEHVNTVEKRIVARREELKYQSLYSFYRHGFAVTRVYLPRERRTVEGADELRKALSADLPVLAGVKLVVGEREGGWRGMRGRRVVSVALHGEDPEYLREVAAEVEERVRGLEDVREIFGPSLTGQQEARVVVDRDRARSLGLTPREVADSVGFAFRGRSLRRYHAPSGEVETRLGLPESLQPGLASLSDLPVPAAGGSTVPLGSVAEVELARTDPHIEREDRRTTTWVNVEFEDSVTTEEGKERVAARLKGLALPAGYSWDWGRWGRERDEALGVMVMGVIVSLLVVILLMAALFESVTQPLAIIITLPLAFFGGFWSLWLLGYNLDAVSFNGIIILIGVVVNNGIVMVDHVNMLRRGGMERWQALIEGCGDRLRPVLMTAITTIFGLVPLALSNFTVATAYVDSLAVVVIGGLATSTIFTLLALPVWYSMLEDLGAIARRVLPRWVALPARGAQA